jgi:hypothetical protein
MRWRLRRHAHRYAALELLDPASNNLYFYANDAFTSPTFIAVQSTSNQFLYQINYLGKGTSWYTAAAILTGGASDNTNFYFIDTTSSLVVLTSSSVPFFGQMGSSDLATIPVDTTSTSLTALGSFQGSIDVFLAPSAMATPDNDLVFVNARSYFENSTEVLTPSGTVKQPLTSNSVFQGLIDQFGARVLEITGITDTDGGYGGGTVNNLSLSTLTLTPFTTMGGDPYTLSSDEGEGEVTSNVIYPISLPQTNIPLDKDEREPLTT